MDLAVINSTPDSLLNLKLVEVMEREEGGEKWENDAINILLKCALKGVAVVEQVLLTAGNLAQLKDLRACEGLGAFLFWSARALDTGGAGGMPERHRDNKS